jgi:Glutathione S-transferase
MQRTDAGALPCARKKIMEEAAMSDPIIYGPAYSTYARSVRLALEEKGVPYKLEAVDIIQGAGNAADHLRRQPFAKVPAFEHDGFALYETGCHRALCG